MFGWFKKQAVEPAKRKEPMVTSRADKYNGFFSTHNELADSYTVDDWNVAVKAFARSFQVPIDKMEVITTGEDGKEVKIAMDDYNPQLSMIKTQNTMYGYLSPTLMAWYGSQGFIGYQTCALIAQHWLVDKAITMPARDAMRHWYEITINDGKNVNPKVVDYIRKRDKDFRVKQHAKEFIRKGRLFGIRIALFKVESADPLYYEKPFNIDGVTPNSYKGIVQVDPYWITPLLDSAAAMNPASGHFYEPTWWVISGKKYHRTHLIIMRNGGDLPDILKPTYLYGGISVPQKIAERVYAAERTANEGPMLAMSKRMTVMNVDITEAMANLQAFSQRMLNWMGLQNNFGVKIVGEDEKVEQFDTALGDVDTVTMTQYQLVSACADVPSTKLIGTSPKGFGASGDYESESYHEFCESLQEDYGTPMVERHHELLMKSEITPKFKLNVTIIAAWKPIDTPTAEEQSDINLKKAQTDQALIAGGVIEGSDARNRIINDPDSGYTGIEEMIPSGPGDPDYEANLRDLALNPPDNSEGFGKAQDESDKPYFDPINGTLDGARLITHQKYLNDDIVQQKVAGNDFVVHVTPPFEMDGKIYRMIFDGHHSLAAAMIAKVEPVFITEIPKTEVMNAITRQATDSNNK